MQKIKNKQDTLVFQNNEKIKQIAKQELDCLFINNSLENIAVEHDNCDQQSLLTKQQQKEKFIWFKTMMLIIINPFNILLLMIAAFELIRLTVIDKKFDPITLTSFIFVFSMVVLTTIIALLEEYYEFKTSHKLKQLVSQSVYLISKNQSVDFNDLSKLIVKKQKIDVEQLQCNDLIYLSSGDIIPVDGRLIFANNFYVNQSSLTGESESVYKTTNLVNENDNIINYSNFCFKGSEVVSGYAILLVTSVNENTYLGFINQTIKIQKETDNFTSNLSKITKIIVFLILIITPILLIINGIWTNQWINAIVFALAVAVGLTPESLPMILTANLTRGVRKMAKDKVIIKKKRVIQNLGAINILCTDKTGTLTEDKINLVNYYDINGNDNLLVLQYSYLNSYFQYGLNNHIDNAILDHQKGQDFNDMLKNYIKLGEIPFDFQRRSLSIILKENNAKQNLLICKGAYEEVINKCQYWVLNNKVQTLTSNEIENIANTVQKLNQQGYRVVCLAYKSIEKNSIFNIDDENGLIFLGFLTFLDQIKPDVISTIATLNNYGIEVKILTGDNEQTTLAVCKQINLQVENVITGNNIDQMDDATLKDEIEKANIFVKLSPLQKHRIIQLYQTNNHKVGFMGDGINDAIALKTSDVAISVNNGAEITKEVSDIVLLEKSLNVLEKGIFQGRNVYGNIIKYLKITVSCNIALMLSLVIGTLMFTFSPMSAIQVLMQNLVYDILNAVVVFDNNDKDWDKNVHNWNIKGLFRFGWWNFLWIVIISITNFIIVRYYLYADFTTLSQVQIQQLQTTFFLESSLIHMLSILVFRTKKIVFFNTKTSWALLSFITISLVLIYSSVYLPVSQWLQFSAPEPVWYLFLLSYGIAFLIIASCWKWLYIKLFKEWL